MNDRSWNYIQGATVEHGMGACPACDYWWGQRMVIQDTCLRCGGTGLDVPVPPGDMPC